MTLRKASKAGVGAGDAGDKELRTCMFESEEGF